MGIEHVFIEYDPAKPTNRFELGTRKLVRTIELEHFKVEAPPPSPPPPSPPPPSPPPPSPPPPSPGPTISAFDFSNALVGPNQQFTITSYFQNGTGRVGRGLINTTQWTAVTSGVPLPQTITETTDFLLEVLGLDGITKVTREENVEFTEGPT